MVNELAKKAPLQSPKFSGTPETPTPAASSTGLQIANMSALATAVAAASRQFKTAVIGVSTNLTLTAAQMGNAVQFNGGAVTLALPALTDVGNGASVILRNPSATATQTIVVASSGSIVDAGTTGGSLALKPFEWAELASSGTAWFVVGRGKLKEVAELDSPVFTGTPEVPTAPVGSATKQAANMAAVLAALQAFGLGTTIGVSIPDFDGVTETGLYRAEGSAKNTPFPNASMALLHIQFNQTGCFQLAAGCSGSIVNARFFWRTKAAGTWADWQQVARLDSPGFTGTPVVPTAPLGTNSGQIASMAALLQAVNAFKRNYSGNVVGVGADITLTGSQTGYAFNVTGPVTVTLPASADAGSGGTFVIRNVSSGGVTVAAGSGKIYEKNNAVSSVVIQPGEWIELQASTSNYFINQRGTLNEIGKVISDAMASFGIGGYNVKSGVDINTLTQGGLAYCINPTNSPVGTDGQSSANGYLLTFQYMDGTTYCAQVFIPSLVGASLDTVHYRRMTAGTWGGWKTLATNDSVAAAINNASRSYRTQAAVGMSTSLTLNTTTHLGALLQFNADALTVTLPSAADVPNGSVVTLRNPRASTQTLAVSAGTIVEEGASVAKMTLQGYEWIELTVSGTAWFVSTCGKLKETATVDQLQEACTPLAPLNSPGFTGKPTVPTAAAAENSQVAANTAFVQRAVNGLAPANSPTFTGTPTAPTQKVNDATKNLATTEFVELSKRNYSGPVLGFSSSLTLTASQSGRLYQANANNLTVTLPAAADAPGGTAYAFRNPTGGPLSITASSGSIVAGVTLATLALQSGEYVELVSNTNTGWFVSSRGKLAETPTVDAMNAALTAAAPPGEVSHFALSSAPTGWLPRNGAAYSRTAYAALFAAIGTKFGAGDGSTTFNVPDDRELIDRAWTDGLNAADSGRGLFTTQAGQNETHTHGGYTSTGGAHVHNLSVPRDLVNGDYGGSGATSKDAVLGDEVEEGYQTLTTGTGGSHNHTLTITATGGNETRMANRAYLACIKY
ncbi:tail fiber protein [Pseudomonas sp. NBRC 111119]|uniref:tail fiber protein n=1 Tax=Pseudomonas sp. NBRC 111119 TaxID=1661034 RepID=UPI0035292F52